MKTVLPAIAAAAFFPVLPGSAAATALPSVRSAQEALPESIARETLAASSRALDFLEASVGSASPRDALFAEGAKCIFFEAGSALPEPLRLRFESLANSAALSPAEAVFCLVAADGAAARNGWRKLAERHIGSRPSPAEVAARALARVEARRQGGETAPADVPPQDFVAHLRHFASSLNLKAADSASFRAVRDPLDPETAFLAALAGLSLPPRCLAGENPVFPKDWRRRIADRLIAQQSFDFKTGLSFWPRRDDPESPDVRETAFALAALSLVAR